MSPSSEGYACIAAPHPPARWRDLWTMLLIDDARPGPLVAIAGAVLAACAWLLASPDRMVSRLMTWDLLFNLEGAWRIRAGQVPHVDFHDPLGSLSFWPTVAGFWLVGTSVFAFIVGQLLVAGVMFAAAATTSVRRLPLAPAILFVLFACLQVLVPTNTGGLFDHFTFAMSYNAYGWAALCVLSLILFLPPRRGSAPAWPDVVVGGVLIAALFYLKITYFLVALGLLAAAFLVCRHIRAQPIAWGMVGAAALANVAAPFNWHYLGDIAATIQAGAVRSGWDTAIVLVTANATELSLAAGVLLVAVALWRAGQAPLRLPAAAAVLIGAALAVLSQNAQLRGLPLCGVALFLMYEQVRRNLAGYAGVAWVLLAILVVPAANVATATASMVSYFDTATHSGANFVVDRTNLRGLAVPLRQDEAVANDDATYLWVNRIRSVGGNIKLSQYEYVQTILEAAAMFHERQDRPGAVLVLDQVSPLSFVLGRPPARGGTLWMDTAFAWQPAEVALAEVAHVLVPKLSTYPGLTEEAVARYGAYLEAQFPLRSESPGWFLFSRPAKPP